MKTKKQEPCICGSLDHKNHPTETPEAQHTPTQDAVILERYEIVTRYLNHQCANSWEQLVKTIVNTEPEIVRAVNGFEAVEAENRRLRNAHDELLEALTLLETAVRRFANGSDSSPSYLFKIAERAKASIAKAEGSSVPSEGK